MRTPAQALKAALTATALTGSLLALAPTAAADPVVTPAAMDNVTATHTVNKGRLTINVTHTGDPRTSQCYAEVVNVTDDLAHDAKVGRAARGTARFAFRGLTPGKTYQYSVSCWDHEIIPNSNDFGHGSPPFTATGAGTGGVGASAVTGTTLTRTVLPNGRSRFTTAFTTDQKKAKCVLFVNAAYYNPGSGLLLGVKVEHVAIKSGKSQVTSTTRTALPTSGPDVNVSAGTFCFDGTPGSSSDSITL